MGEGEFLSCVLHFLYDNGSTEPRNLFCDKEAVNGALRALTRKDLGWETLMPILALVRDKLAKLDRM